MKPSSLLSRLLLSGALLGASSCWATSSVPEIVPFHTQEQSVKSLNFLPPPPTEQSPAFADDKATYLEGYALKGTPRWQLATKDADLSVGNMASIFSPVLGITLSESKTPATWHMLQNLLIVGDYAPVSAKNYYMRTRPFVVYGHHTCQPVAEEAGLRKNGSYPSGHTTLGTLIGLVLSEAKPDRADELAKRAYDFGQSRVICGAHWQSDVNAGRYVGAVEYARLHTIPAFNEALKQVQQELNP